MKTTETQNYSHTIRHDPFKEVAQQVFSIVVGKPFNLSKPSCSMWELIICFNENPVVKKTTSGTENYFLPWREEFPFCLAVSFINFQCKQFFPDNVLSDCMVL